MTFKIDKNRNTWTLRHYVGGKWPAVRKGEYPPGLDASWPLDKAREYVKHLRALDVEGKRQRILEEGRVKRSKQHAYLPGDVVEAFVKSRIEPQIDKAGKLLALWGRVQALVVGVGIEAPDWYLDYLVVHAWVVKQGWTADYSNRVLSLANKWGYLYCRKRATSFLPVPKLAGKYLVTARENIEGRERKSKPLDKLDLRRLKSNLSPEQYRWVEVCFWFGLRPEECDQVAQYDGQKLSLSDSVMHIYQPKLRAIPKRDRWKHIPAWLPEQTALLTALLNKASLTRPPRYQVRKCFPEGVTLYGCRHGFTSYMQQRGQPMQTISAWLGHRSIVTTERYYKDMGLTTSATPTPHRE